LGELANKFYREGNDDAWRLFFKFIKSTTKIMVLSTNLAEKSGRQKYLLRKRVKDIGLADAIIYQTAVETSTRLISGDDHFKDFQDVVYLKEINSAKKMIQEIGYHR
ncbi:MAG: PIN domain-containing protein, partial [Promethearchaeota archaeon]